MASAAERMSFSPCGGQLGVCRPDGVLRVYDARAGAVRGEVAPSKHLLAACTCLAWRPAVAPAEENKTPKKGRKRKSSLSNGDATSPNKGSTASATTASNELVVGTASGSVVVYSTKVGDYKEVAVHEGPVQDVAWSVNGQRAFSCSLDGHVGCVNVKRLTVTARFVPEGVATSGPKREPLNALAVAGESDLLVGSVGRILWLDVDTRSVLKQFVGGHVGAVSSLALLSVPGLDGALLFSAGASEKDRTVAVWRVEKGASEEEARPETTLGVNEVVSSVSASMASISPEDDEVGDVLVACVSTSGVLRLFEVDPNARRKKLKTLRAKASVQVATEKDSKGRVLPIPIMAARVEAASSADQSAAVHVAHGSAARPAFETLNYASLDKNTCLVRDKVESRAEDAQDFGVKFMAPAAVAATTVLAPGSAMSTGAVKRKPSGGGGKMEDLPMLDRLRLLSKDVEQVTTPPRTDSLLQLLMQGLHNRDERILSSVLDRTEEATIDKTTRKLPVEGVVPLIEELHKHLKGRGMVNAPHAKWLRAVLQHHSAFLMSHPSCHELLGPMLAMVEARVKHHESIIRLKGKLDLMTKQIAASKEEGEGPSTSGEYADKQALLVYQDDSSDELSDVLDDLLLPSGAASDNEESWNMDLDDEEEGEEDREDDDDDDDDDEEEEDSEDSEAEEPAVKVVNGVGHDDEEMESE